jgi:hypothetical protein
MHRLLHGNTQVVTLMTVGKLMSETQIQRALARLREEYWCLSVVIEESEEGLWFREGSDNEEHHIIHMEAGDNFCGKRALEQELADVISSHGYLWRMRAVIDHSQGKTHFLFARNHAISDGYTTAVILSNFLRLLNGYEPGTGGTKWLGFGEWSECIRAASTQTENMTRMEQMRYAFPGRNDAGNCAPKVSIVDLHNETLVHLRSVARRHGCSSNDLLSAAWVRSVCGALDFQEIALFTAVSLRGRVSREPIVQTGCFITVVATLINVEGSLIQLALRHRSALRNAIATWEQPSNNHQAIKDKVIQLKKTTTFPGIAVTNVGSGPSDATGLLGVEEYRTVVNRCAGNYGMVLHLSTLNDQLTATVAYPQNLMPDCVVEEVVARFSHDIKSI